MKRRLALSLSLAGAMVLFFAGSISAGVIANVAVPFEQVIEIPCAGESVLLTGFLHILVTETADANGSLHTTTHFQPMGAVGTGLTTGDVYHATGITRDEANGLEVPFETTFVNNFRIIGPGTGNNFLVHEVFHVTINANGVITVLADHLSVDCK